MTLMIITAKNGGFTENNHYANLDKAGGTRPRLEHVSIGFRPIMNDFDHADDSTLRRETDGDG